MIPLRQHPAYGKVWEKKGTGKMITELKEQLFLYKDKISALRGYLHRLRVRRRAPRTVARRFSRVSGKWNIEVSMSRKEEKHEFKRQSYFRLLKYAAPIRAG